MYSNERKRHSEERESDSVRERGGDEQRKRDRGKQRYTESYREGKRNKYINGLGFG